ncbi:alpha/beta hydrolase family protein [Hyphococcus sp.]|uniref:alpha/beta hydrolase family protein n=1 Tax=Hyphococcus sp. TaxID=2038636 RepID=UPI0035C675DE
MRTLLSLVVIGSLIAAGYFWHVNRQPPVVKPQTPQPPFSYDVDDVTVTARDGVTLAGTITTPQGDGPHPAVILLSVAGPDDRDQSYRGHKSFQVIADALARQGVAAARFDDRGAGGSGGDYFAADWNTLKEDALAIRNMLAADPRIDAMRIGFAGMSEGGAIAAMAARDAPGAAFVILLSAPGLPGEAALKLQLENTLNAYGISGEEADRYRVLFTEFISIVTSDPQAEETRTRLEAFLKGPGRALIPPYGFMPKTVEGQIDLFLGPWYQSNLHFDPAPVYGALASPVLAIGGGLDPIAPPAHHLKAIEALLAQAPTDDFSVQRLDGLNHLLQEADTGLPTEYAKLDNTISEDALALIADWLARRGFGTPTGGT